MAEEWISVGDAVARLRSGGMSTSEQTIRRLADEGVLVSRRNPFGRRDRAILVASVDEMLAQWKASSSEQGEAED